MENFTQKEIEVLKYVCKGYTNEAIAQKLFVSIHTVKAHIASLLRKTGAAATGKSCGRESACKLCMRYYARKNKL